MMAQQIFILDNYDSFTYNLVHLVESVFDGNVIVLKNDEENLMQKLSNADKIILSPGPGLPSESNQLLSVIKNFHQTKSLLGVCLGHQAIAESFGGSLFNSSKVFHGIAEKVNIVKKDSKIFFDFPESFLAGRYHSWLVDEKTLPDCFEITARDEARNIMAMQHKIFDIQSVQFHPESILTENGKLLMKNWIEK